MSSSSSSSSSSDSSDVEEILEDLKVEEKDKADGAKTDEEKTINILLIGSTGVGKSTFINSVSNYLVYKYMDVAAKRKLVTRIPSTFTIKDNKNVDHEVRIGPDDEIDQNEVIQTGVSATQKVRSYVYYIRRGRSRVRLIDTPGMGDTRGIEQDELNCDNIINYVSTLSKLHAVCILLRPTNPRMTIFFQYCLSQILCRLEKSACDNIFFMFTNTRGSNYDGGQTLPVLREYCINVTKASPDVKISLILNKNIFCFDNEGFKYLAAVQKLGIECNSSSKEHYRKSWKTSGKSCWSFVKMIQKKQAYSPHNLADIENARRVLSKLSKALARINQRFIDNSTILQRLQSKETEIVSEVEELKKKQFITITDVKKVDVSTPCLVCTSNSCAKVFKVGSETKWHYSTICHAHCSETGAAIEEMIGCPELVNCFTINQSTKKCVHCGCDFSVHMLIKYRTILNQEQLLEDQVVQQIRDKETGLGGSKVVINNLMDETADLEKERTVILEFCKQIVGYLRTKTILPYNNCYKEYIEYLKIQKQTVGDTWIDSSVKDLDMLLNSYEEYQKLFDDHTGFDEASCPINLSKSDIDKALNNELFTLKNMGRYIREIFDQDVKIINIDDTPKEYVHPYKYEKKHRHRRDKKHKEDKKEKENKKVKDGKKQKEEKASKKDKDDSNKQKQNNKKDKSKNTGEPQHRSRSPPPAYSQAVHNQHSDPRRDNYPRPEYSPMPYGNYAHGDNRGYGNGERNDYDTNQPKYEVKVTINKGSSHDPPSAPPHPYGPVPSHPYGPPPPHSYGPPPPHSYGPPPPHGYGPPPPPSYVPPPPHNYGPPPPHNYGPPPPHNYHYGPSTPSSYGPPPPPPLLQNSGPRFVARNPQRPRSSSTGSSKSDKPKSHGGKSNQSDKSKSSGKPNQQGDQKKGSKEKEKGKGPSKNAETRKDKPKDSETRKDKPKDSDKKSKK